MTRSDGHDAPLEEARELIDQLLDGELAPQGAARLESLVCERPDVRRFYILQCHLWCNLAPHVMGSERLARHLPLVDGGGILETSLDDQPADNAAASLAGGETMILPAIRGKEAAAEHERVPARPRHWEPARERIAPPKRRRFSGWYGIAAAVVLALFAGWYWTRPDAVSAMLADAVDAQWESPDGAPRRGRPLPSGPLHLKAGVAEIRFGSGVSMIIQAPARFHVQSDVRTDLNQGKLVATVPSAAIGFIVQTDVARVIDLGTEFGVEVKADGSTRVEVFRGRVQADALRAPSANQATRQLVAGEAAQVDPGATAVQQAAPSPQSFVRADELAARKAQLGSAYHRWLAHSDQLRRDPSLALYYTFDNQSEASDRLLNRAEATAARFAGVLGHGPNVATRPSWTAGRWPEKGALDFGARARQGVFASEFPFTTNGRLTVAAWVNARSRSPWGAIVKNRGGEGGRAGQLLGQFSLGLYDTEGTLVARVTQRDAVDVLAREPKSSPLPTGTWVHVALVADGATLRLYRDGREVAAAPCGPAIANPTPRSLAVGYRAGADGKPAISNGGEHWDGAVDELAVFHRALSAQEIRRMYESGVP